VRTLTPTSLLIYSALFSSISVSVTFRVDMQMLRCLNCQNVRICTCGSLHSPVNLEESCPLSHMLYFEMPFNLLQEATQMSVMVTRLLYQLPRSGTRNPLSCTLRSSACKCFQTHSTYVRKLEWRIIFRLVWWISQVDINLANNICLKGASFIRHGNVLCWKVSNMWQWKKRKKYGV